MIGALLTRFTSVERGVVPLVRRRGGGGDRSPTAIRRPNPHIRTLGRFLLGARADVADSAGRAPVTFSAGRECRIDSWCVASGAGAGRCTRAREETSL